MLKVLYLLYWGDVMKILIYGDPHVNKYPQGLVKERQDLELGLFKYIYEDLVSKYNVELCVCLGDFLHNSYLPASDVDYVLSLLDTMQGVSTFILTGNHDRSSKEDSLIKFFDRVNTQIHTIDKIETIGINGKVLTFISNGMTDELPNYDIKSSDYIFTHEDYPGSIMNSSGTVSKSGYVFKDGTLKKSAVIFNGHIHCSGEILSSTGRSSYKIYNVGAVSPIAYGEIKSNTFPVVMILDTETNELNYEVVYPMMPLTCNYDQYKEFCEFYPEFLHSCIRLRLTYEGDLPEFKHTDEYLSVEFKKLLHSGLGVDEEVSLAEVEDIIVDVPHYVDTMIDSSDIEESEKLPIKNLCNDILSK